MRTVKTYLQPSGIFLALATVFAGEGGPQALDNSRTPSQLPGNSWFAGPQRIPPAGDAGSEAVVRDHRGVQAGAFCSDSANSGKVCNVAKGCGCSQGECVDYLAAFSRGGATECEEDLTEASGPAYDAPPCTSSSSEGDACSSSLEDIASGCATPGLAGVCAAGPFGPDAVLECVTFDPNVELQECVSDTSLCGAGADTCTCNAGVCVDSEIDARTRPYGSFCSDPANFGHVCNVAQGCGCFTGIGCIHPRAILRLGGPLQCEEDLTGASGPAYHAPPCTSSSSEGDSCSPLIEDITSGCAMPGLAGVCITGALGASTGLECAQFNPIVESQACLSDTCRCEAGSETCECSSSGLCFDRDADADACRPDHVPGAAPAVPTPDDGKNVIYDDPHMTGLRGQRIDWYGINGGWYSVIQDNKIDLIINARLTAPLPDEFPDRQFITGLSILSGGHSLTIEVKNPYTVDTDGCPSGVADCLVNGGLRAGVDGDDVNDLLRFSRQTRVAGGAILVSASNLPMECRQDKENVMVESERLEDWILSSHKMAAPEWCTRYIAENDLSNLRSKHAIVKITTPAATVRLSAGISYQDGGQLDRNGRILPALEFWQMHVGLDGLNIDSASLTGILGETTRPVYDEETGNAVMEGFNAFRGEVDDYRVDGPLGTHFTLMHERDGLGVIARVAIACGVLCSAVYLSSWVRARMLKVEGIDVQHLGQGRNV